MARLIDTIVLVYRADQRNRAQQRIGRDALWAYAECFGVTEIVSEDFEHGRHLGRVRIFDPFLAASDQVRELPALYEASQ